MTGRRVGRSKQLLDDLKEMKWYWKFEREAADGALWRSRFGRGYGPAIILRKGRIYTYTMYIRLAGYAIPRTAPNSRSNTCLLSTEA